MDDILLGRFTKADIKITELKSQYKIRGKEKGEIDSIHKELLYKNSVEISNSDESEVRQKEFYLEAIKKYVILKKQPITVS